MNPLDDTELMLARGKFATIRAEHEECKAEFAKLCNVLSQSAAQALRRIQPDNNAVPESIDDLLNAARNSIDAMQALAYEMQRLAKERGELKTMAWGKGK